MNDPIIYGSNSLYCDAAGAGKLWEPCSKTNDCGAGLICHVPASEAKGYCSRACGDGFPECKAIEEECGLQGDGSGMFYISSAVKGCEVRGASGWWAPARRRTCCSRSSRRSAG